MDTQELIREALVKVTGLIPHEGLAGIAFGAGLVLSEYTLSVLTWK